MEKLEKIFNPKTIAVVGASNEKGKVGYSLMKNLVCGGYKGVVYPINPKRKRVQGIKAYASINKTPNKVDLAIITTPAKTVPGIVKECGIAGIKGVVIISSGFKESGKKGKKLYNQISGIIKKYGIRVVGPNCLGFIRPKLNLNASFANKMALPGKIAFISQSGALGTAVLDWSVKQNVGFSNFVSIGSMIDVGFHDLIDYFGNDAETESILIYMESLSNARKFLSAARAFARTKPIIVLKVGKSLEGTKAAESHTGSLAGNDAVFNAAFKRAGIIRVDTISELFDCAQTLAMQEIPKGKRLAIVTNAGGPGVIATDYLIEKGGELAELSEETIKELNKVLPEQWSKSNPVDILGDAGPERFRKTVELCLKDKGVDGVLIILTPQTMTESSAVAKKIVKLQNKNRKIILTSWMGGEDVNKGRNILKKAGIPVYTIPENAVRSFMNMYRYSRNIELLYETPASIPHSFVPKTEKNKKLIKKVLEDKRSVLTELESKKLISNYGIPIFKNAVAKTPNQAAKLSSEIGFPVVMKILSSEILHKTDIGGVKLNVKSKKEAINTFNDIRRSVKKYNPKESFKGILIEKMVSKKYEILIGSKKDPIFGPTVVFGMGGVAVEVFKDTNVALPPLNMALSMRLIEETKIYKLLKGYRGIEGVDIKSIQFLLYKFAYLVMDFPEIKEIDINPLAVDEKGGVVLDAKVILDKNIVGKKIKPYSHMVISPYPKEYVTKFTMKDGKTATLRPIRPEDEPLEEEMFKQLSEETKRFRFFGQIKDITHELLIRYTQIDYDREIAIIAEVTEKKKKRMMGVARLIADPNNKTAEFAIVVVDQWHNQGLGNKLTDYILRIAKKRKIKKVYANVLMDNHIMLRIFKKRGFKIIRQEKACYAELEF